MDFSIAPLHRSHQKKDFHCGKELLDIYLHRQATQDVKRKLAACFVLVDTNKVVKGYYTLSNTSIPKGSIPADFGKRLPPSYTNLSATLLGRLAVDRSAAGQGLGEFLLVDSLKRSYAVASHDIASLAVVVDPIDESALHFYEKYGFILLPGSGKMFLPMKTIARLYE